MAPKHTHATLTVPPLALALALAAGTVQAASQPSVEQRLARVEKLVESRGLLDLLTRVEQLQNEVRQLRGLLEEQGYKLEEMEGRQRNLYGDIDRRLRRLEAGGIAAVAAPPAAPGTSPQSGGGETPAAAAASTAADGAAERSAYEGALDLLREGRYGEAIEAFRRFVAEHPRSAYADNAQYWLGEANYVTRNFEAAVAEFGKVISDYPESTKLADALLKTGYVYYELGRWGEARQALTRVVTEHSQATAAKLAQQRLDKMKAEGH